MQQPQLIADGLRRLPQSEPSGDVALEILDAQLVDRLRAEYRQKMDPKHGVVLAQRRRLAPHRGKVRQEGTAGVRDGHPLPGHGDRVKHAGLQLALGLRLRQTVTTARRPLEPEATLDETAAGAPLPVPVLDPGSVHLHEQRAASVRTPRHLARSSYPQCPAREIGCALRPQGEPHSTLVRGHYRRPVARDATPRRRGVLR
jgi:hypothetical protein